MKWLVILALFSACKKQEIERRPIEPLPPAEVQRAHDACRAYVDKVCGCTSPAAQKQCPFAKPLPDALDLELATAANPGEERDTTLRAQVSVRETVKECVEELAKLPALGCR
jgi:hypothetical protein